jgi:hypothetical protein
MFRLIEGRGSLVMKRLVSIVAISFTMFGLLQPVRASTGSNCAYLLVPVSEDGGVTSASPTLIGCYATYSEALAAGSDGSIDVPPATTPTSLSDATLAEAATALAVSDVLIGTEWNLNSYAGTSTSYFATSTCSSTQSWELSYVGDTWNDRFSSGKGFGGCNTNKKFEASNFGGSVLTCTPNCADYGALSNEVSSLKWKP